MRRLRILQFVLPALLVLFVVWLVVEFRAVDDATKPEIERDNSDERVITGVEWVETVGGTRKLSAFVGELVEADEGRLHFVQIRNFTFYRRDQQQPVEIDADRGVLSGPPGARRIDFEGRVVFRDLRDGLTLRIPDLRVDEAAGEAWADDAVVIEAGNVGGSAGALVYGLEGQPTRFENLDLTGDDGTRLQARQALLFDGLDDAELVGDVRIEGPSGDRFEADRARFLRKDGRLSWIRAQGAVQAEFSKENDAPMRTAGDELEADWDRSGAPERVHMRGSAELTLGAHSIHGDDIETIRRTDTDQGIRWALGATGTVVVQGALADGRGWLRCNRFQAEADAEGGLLGAEASGEVRFKGGGAEASASRATLRDGDDRMQIILWGTPRRKARLTRERLEVAAVQIRTDSTGSFLDASGKVEATVLPTAAGEEAGPLQGMFHTAEAIHFVSETMEGKDHGRVTTFRGTVRAWQGERNLSAETVTLQRDARTLHASERVSSRFPRREDQPGTAAEDFIQIVADTLNFSDAQRRAVYEGHVRVRLTEGWVETTRLEADLLEDGGIEEIRGLGAVRLEFRRPSDEGEDEEWIHGNADRLVYVPADETIVLYGDTTPATVTQVGAGESRARVLRYRLDSGQLEVDSGDSDHGSIRTGEPG
ncbi:MAG: hypothetical protein OES25_09410 [Acidobacteriota bacterium]|nr:hypothetical protein [Acidobacteriota bacterium]